MDTQNNRLTRWTTKVMRTTWFGIYCSGVDWEPPSTFLPTQVFSFAARFQLEALRPNYGVKRAEVTF